MHHQLLVFLFMLVFGPLQMHLSDQCDIGKCQPDFQARAREQFSSNLRFPDVTHHVGLHQLRRSLHMV